MQTTHPRRLAFGIWLLVVVVTTTTGDRATLTRRRPAHPASAPVATRPAQITPPDATAARPAAEIVPTVPAAGAINPVTPLPSLRSAQSPSDYLRYVSKTSLPLPADYVPSDLQPLPPGYSEPAGLPLRREAALAFIALAAAARRDGAVIVAVSTYRSFDEQASIYRNEVQQFGQAQADRQAAVPGFSEHQLGTTADLSTPGLRYDLSDLFGRLAEGVWMERHAADYGFVLSYPEGEEAVTGYRYEPWHYRFVGVMVARYIAASGRTSTEILGQMASQGVDLSALPRLPAAAGGCPEPATSQTGC